MKSEVIPIEDLVPDPANVRRRDDDARQTLANSVRAFGAARSIVVDGKGVVRAGNGTLEAAKAAGITKALVVEASGDELVVVRRKDWSPTEATAYAIADNRTSDKATNDDVALAEQLRALQSEDFDLGAVGYTDAEVDGLIQRLGDEVLAGEPVDDPDIAQQFLPYYPGEPSWGVPILDLAMQADALITPVTKWGTIGRSAMMPGTYHFYTDDYKFYAVWSEPDQILLSGCRVAIEPNYSTTPDMPRAEVLWTIYRKRWLARYWQSKGLRIIADLNVDPAFRDLAFLGLPPGWGAYAVRSQSEIPLDVIKADYASATEHSGAAPTLFVVVGGGRAMSAECQKQGWVYVPEDCHVAEGREVAYG